MGNPPKLTAAQVEECSATLRTIRSIDESITWLGESIDSEMEEWGRAARKVIGPNRLPFFLDEELGGILFAGVVNALLLKRGRFIEEIKDTVDAPDAPCPRQVAPDATD